jgi:hypothetical protein
MDNVGWPTVTDFVTVKVHRRCGHSEQITIQPPIDYVIWLAREELCARCCYRGNGRQARRLWWPM